MAHKHQRIPEGFNIRRNEEGCATPQELTGYESLSSFTCGSFDLWYGTPFFLVTFAMALARI